MINFNEQQLKAINFKDGACAVIAGAGSGKSTVLVNRIENLVLNHGVKEDDILTITFTHNAADNLKSKLNKMGLKDVNVGTFHSICAKILCCEGFDLSKKPMEWQIENLFMTKEYGSKKPNIDDIMSFISYQKNYMKSYNDTFMPKDSDYTEEELRIFFKNYENYKTKNKMYDFDDWMLECYKILNNNSDHNYHWKYVLVDEHQDSNLVQNLLLHEWCKTNNVFAVFDYRQAIYTFRGGNPDYCMNFDKEWNNATVVNLDTNYRSNKDLVEKANNFIKQYYGNYKYYSDSIANSVHKANIKTEGNLDRKEESDKIVNEIEKLLKEGENPNEIAVLFRLNSHSNYVEAELKKRNISYYISNDSSFFKRTEINGIMSYLRLIDNPHDNCAFENIFKLRNYPIKYFSNEILENVKSFAGRNNLSLYESFTLYKYDKKWQELNVKIFEQNIEKLRLQKDKNISISNLIDNIKMAFNFEEYIQDKYANKEEQEDRLGSIETLKSFVKGNNIQSFINFAYNPNNKQNKNTKDCVQLMSIHASKGLEFKNVFIIGIQDGKFPHLKSDLIDEARLFYVAVTRPKENLYLSQIYDDNLFVNQYI